MTEATEQAKPKSKKEKSSRRIPVGTILLIGGAFIVGFIIVGVITIQAWEYSNSVGFCADACHDVHPEEVAAFQDSYHANIKCTECHMGRGGTIENIFRKASHFRHLPEVIFDAYDRPLESETMRPANESCELCHWPPAFHGDTVRRVTRFELDEENTPKDTYLILKTGAGTREEGLGYGIHWHITNPVEYIATDEHKEHIRWVRTTLPDGRTVEYNDVTNPLTPEELEEAETKVMDCVDCHNRMGHPFPSPEEMIDQALHEGRLNPDLPNVKRLMVDLITADYATQDEALEAVAAIKGQYAEAYPETAAQYSDDIEAAEVLAEELIRRLVFEEPGVTWKNFPDHNKHKDFAGCFRCHDGKHLSDDGESIRLQCNICHSVPVKVGAGERAPQSPLAYIQEPESHLETNFIADHRFQANSVCVDCHGEVDFGKDDSSFCANSSCHGRAWPAVELDAAFPHPIELEGKHAEAWCHDCHVGEREPEYICSNCHEPPPAHFGPDCEDCHTPAGFEGADMGDFQHPLSLENAHANAECADCHVEGTEIKADCSSCHEPPPAHFGPDCEDCHTPAGFEGADMGDFQHPLSLENAHAKAECADCHVEGTEIKADCSSCHEPPEAHLPGECEDCHTPEGFAQSAASIVDTAPGITHALEGRDDCLMCHDPEGQIKPAPSNHADYQIEQCTLCHRTEE